MAPLKTPSLEAGILLENQALLAENSELKIRLREMQETIDAIHGGEVDAFMVAGDLYTLERAGASANRLRQNVLAQMRDSVFAFDHDGRVIFVNAAAEARYGVSLSDVMGLHVEQIFTETSAPELEVLFAEGADQISSPAAHLSEHCLANGERIFVETLTSELRDADGIVIGSLAVVRDITDRARAAALLAESERRLRQANEGLESAVTQRTRELMAAEEALRQAQKMEAVGQLTGGIAHDFNNLLAAISGSMQVMELRIKSGRFDSLDRYTGIARQSINRAAALTQRLLAFARRQTLDPKPMDASALVQGLIGLIERTVGPTIEIQTSSEPGLWLAKIDGAQLENSLLNLCINARDAMGPAGGQLSVRAANAVLHAERAAVYGIAAGDYVTLTVTDTGAGMPPDVIERAFDPFFTTKPVGQGTGLGLSMVYGFVRQSGGHVVATSQVGQGTCMTMFFPRFRGEVVAEPVAEAADTLDRGAGETLLIVEDEEVLRVLMEEALQEAGFNTLFATNGESALAILHSSAHIDLLITDVGLPGGMNGRQIADAARVVRTDLKTLFVTGYAEIATIRDGHLESGMEVLTKPFEFSKLIGKVRDMMEN
jgi:PAS domain S-box-containing protein